MRAPDRLLSKADVEQFLVVVGAELQSPSAGTTPEDLVIVRRHYDAMKNLLDHWPDFLP